MVGSFQMLYVFAQLSLIVHTKVADIFTISWVPSSYCDYMHVAARSNFNAADKSLIPISCFLQTKQFKPNGIKLNELEIATFICWVSLSLISARVVIHSMKHWIFWFHARDHRKGNIFLCPLLILPCQVIFKFLFDRGHHSSFGDLERHKKPEKGKQINNEKNNMIIWQSIWSKLASWTYSGITLDIKVFSLWRTS